MLARKLLDNFNNNIRGDIRIRFFNYLEAGLDAKFPPSCYYMALLLAGEGDIEEAFHLFKNAAEKKYPPAQYELAQMYWYGNDYVKQSYQRALVWGIGALANGMQDASWIVEDCQERLSWQEVRKAQEAAESKIRDV
ncbi:MAG: hypothetical protein A2051_06170 [Desulfovibrionales bacterium GWA2_65_9]|nr:MAG: hypothetical protein A2051_06170 [Desulfovibrionales bacterium GWA2_65_9]